MEILYDNPKEDLLSRLFKIRHIQQDMESFLNPSFSNSWIDPYLLNDFDKAINRIQKAIQKNEKIIILWDYDVDWITSSYLFYKFFSKFLNHKNISIRLPNRLKDGYWMRDYHLDEIKKTGASLVITVDNWITWIQEAEHAQKIWLDLIITDHHKATEQIPKAVAVVNPQISPNYWFKQIAWVWVAFKIITWLINKYINDPKKKKQVLNYLLPVVAIWTVADCVPLLWENRLLTKMWLDAMNKNQWIPQSIANFIKYLNIKNNIDTFHIWFMIAPRLNASGRMQNPYDSLSCLLCSGESQLKYLQNLEWLNNLRKETQESWFQQMEKSIDKRKKILIWQSSELHEWVVWIIAWKITEKYNKPSVIITIKEDEWTAVWSLRWPEYFSIIDMLNNAWDYLERYWWHQQAGGMTVKLENLDKVKQIFVEYAKKHIKKEDIQKKTIIDTKIYPHEINQDNISKIQKLSPYWEWNPEPVFLIENLIFENIEKVGKNWKWHLKAYTSQNGINFPVIFWWKWEELDYIKPKQSTNLVWKIRKDNYNDGFFVDGSSIE